MLFLRLLLLLLLLLPAALPASPRTCRVCRGKPRVCTCYLYKKVNGVRRCSYQDKESCEAKEVPPAPAPDYANKTALALCGDAAGFTRHHSKAGAGGRVPRRGRVVGGAEAEYTSWPWVVSLQQWNPNKASYQHKCGATLVERQWVVTAAHCVWEVEVGRVQVVLGEHDFYHREQHPTSTSKLSSLVIHPDFDPVTFENDLAVLKLEVRVDWQPNILPACLPDSPQGRGAGRAGGSGWVVGWGVTKQGGTLSPVLRELKLPLLSNRDCERLYRAAGQPQAAPTLPPDAWLVSNPPSIL